MKKRIIVGMVLVITVVATSAVNASNCCGKKSEKNPAESKKAAKLQTTCPVMGKKINKSLYVDHEGQRIYVCCKGCIAPIRKAPAKYIKKITDKGEVPAKLQTTCPVMGGKINKKQYVDHDGKRIYVCCPGCIGKIKADPEKYVKKLEKEGITLNHTPKKKHDEKKEGHGGHH